MRTEQEMYNLILKVAEHDERIRAVFMDGLFNLLMEIVLIYMYQRYLMC